jgi:type II secretion system protein I
MTLLEVMVATAMVLASVMALSRVAFLARKHTHGAEDRSTAQMHCHNIMEEIACGVRPLQTVAPQEFEGDEWMFSVDVTALDRAGLAQVTVTVDRVEEEEGLMPTEDQLGGYRLVRWIRTGDRTLDLEGTELEAGDSFEDAALDSNMDENVNMSQDAGFPDSQ